jgi:transcriptional regulator with GAF, ATPase, and Fis domain
MTRPTTIQQLRERHRADELRFVRAALEANDWSLNPTARHLGIGVSSLQALIRKLGLEDDYRERCPPRGRPAKQPSKE